MFCDDGARAWLVNASNASRAFITAETTAEAPVVNFPSLYEKRRI